MQSNQFPRTRVAAAIAGVVLALGAGQALGTGFQLNENSGSSLGNAFAAGAAFTDDASAMWWNPAALSQFTTIQGVGALNIITPSIKFKNNASLPALNQPLGGDGGDAGGNNYVPNLYVSVPINAQWTFGLGVNAPFGLKTEYDNGWIGRYQGLKSEIKTINVNPVLSWKVTPQFAVGVGVNYMDLSATLTQNANYSYAYAGVATGAAAAGIIPASLVPQIIGATSGLDSTVTIKGDDGAWGWNIGFAWDATPQLRLAAAYRSETKFNVKANSDFNNPTPAPPPGTSATVLGAIALLKPTVDSNFQGKGLTSDITLPQIANLSMLYRVNSQWEIMADAQYTGWSSIPELRFVPTNGSPSSAVPLNWDDSWKISAGASYRVNDQWKARFGVAYDQSPVTNDPTVKLPDSDRWWLATGVEYKWTPNWKFDAGFAYIFADSPSFNQNQGNTQQNALVNGKYDASVWILSMQVAYAFSPPPQPVKVAEVAPPPPAPVAKPAPPPPPPAPPPAPTPQVQKIVLDAKVLFDFDKSVLKPEGKAAIDNLVVGNLAKIQKLDVVLVTGHTDRIGTEKYNQGLSERRADSVRDYLVSKGVDKAKIETIGLGEKQPVVQCAQKNFKELIACLQPNRRVEVEVKGEAKK
jgi:long-chain fatty acid transport protein